jgi:hypothetical protein
MNNDKDLKKQVTIPENILKYSEKVLGFFPSIIETDYYTIDALRSMLSKNKIIWSNKHFDGSATIYSNGIIEFKSEILFYFVKRKNEITYKFYCLSKEDSTDSIVFYLNQLKKFKTVS